MSEIVAAALAAACGRHLGAAARIENLRRESGGASRQTWSFDAVAGSKRHELILRRDPPTVAGAEKASSTALDRATAYMDSTGRPYALVMQKGSVAPYKLNKKGLSGVRQRALNERAEVQTFESASERVPRRDALERVIAHTPKDSTVVLASTGFCGRELYAIDDRENQVYLVGSMGCVTPMALGLALSRPDLQVIALDGDGAALMRMGVFATLGAYGPANLTHLLLDNGAHESTGGQATVSQGVEFARIASACGYALTLDGDDLSVIDRLFEAKDIDGVRFARLSINTGTPSDLPRPSITPEDVRRRLQAHIGR